LQSRYYDPILCRFLNADGLASTGQGVLGANMFAYCGNAPVNHKDVTGKTAMVIIDVVVRLIKDIYQLVRDDDQRVSVTKEQNNGETNIRINNSASIVTPTVQYVYSVYLNHFSEYKDDINGSTAGMMFEWEVHNAVYYALQAAKNVGIDRSDLIKRAESVDLGPTIYHDKHGDAGSVMKWLYSVTNLVSAIYDAMVYAS